MVSPHYPTYQIINRGEQTRGWCANGTLWRGGSSQNIVVRLRVTRPANNNEVCSRLSREQQTVLGMVFSLESSCRVLKNEYPCRLNEEHVFLRIDLCKGDLRGRESSNRCQEKKTEINVINSVLLLLLRLMLLKGKSKGCLLPLLVLCSRIFRERGAVNRPQTHLQRAFAQIRGLNGKE